MDDQVKAQLQPGDVAIAVLADHFVGWNGAGWDPERPIAEFQQEAYQLLFGIEDTGYYRPLVTPVGPFIRSKKLAACEVEIGQFYRSCSDDDPDREFIPAEKIEVVSRKGGITRFTTVDPKGARTSYSMPYHQVIRVYIDNPTPVDPHVRNERLILAAAMSPVNSPRYINSISSRCGACGQEARVELTFTTSTQEMLAAIDQLRGPCPSCQADFNDFLAEDEPPISPGELEA